MPNLKLRLTEESGTIFLQAQLPDEERPRWWYLLKLDQECGEIELCAGITARLGLHLSSMGHVIVHEE